MLIVGQFAQTECAATLDLDLGGTLYCVRHCGFEQLTSALLAQLSPEVVISALIGPSFDAADLAQHLAALGYAGAYKVMGSALPDPSKVGEELRRMAPGLDIEVIAAVG